MDYALMQPTRVGLPNSCCICGQPVAENHWMAEHNDAARSGAGVCVGCWTQGRSAEELQKMAGQEPSVLQQVIGDIPDEDLLVTGAAAAAENADTNPEADFTVIKGVGPATAKRLVDDAGIFSFRDLAEADAGVVAAMLDTTAEKVAGWQLQAEALLKA